METAIGRACQTIAPVMLANARRSFMKRMASGLEENGSYVDHLL